MATRQPADTASYPKHRKVAILGSRSVGKCSLQLFEPLHWWQLVLRAPCNALSLIHPCYCPSTVSN